MGRMKNSSRPNIRTSRFCERFQLETPIALAPMAHAAGGALSAACANAGALGLVGGGYGDLAWTQREYALALRTGPRERIGCGFITWCMDKDASPLDWVLDQKPRALMLSFGDPRPYAARIAASGAALICQVQRIDQVPQALDAGAEVIVAQGGEAGGHSISPTGTRGLMTLIPEMADWLAANSPQTMLLGAGGIGDGRTLAAALALGADGVLVGTRLWAARESLASEASKAQSLKVGGDGTIRSEVYDVFANRKWPDEFGYTRAARNALQQQWEGRLPELATAAPAVRSAYDAGVKAGDFSRAFITVGEAVGLIHDIPPAGELIARMTTQAVALLGDA